MRLMDFPERLVDRQIDRGRGTRAERIQAVRTAQNFLAFACVLGFVSVAINLFGTGPFRALWMGLGVLWVAVAALTWRQRRYVDRLALGEGR